ncbi:MAG TPA: hypothetical protein VFW34_10915 [Candidatus Rubrimentiphilum sp.]|nr:hypothetical protein [Candidatus Rubrimentiphilum sp.]
MKGVLLTALLFACALARVAAKDAQFGDLSYRWLGPAVMGGRLDAVAGIPGDPTVVYLAHSSGGLWKSQNGGLSFASVFEAGRTEAIGAIAIDPNNARRVLIGTGEGFPRNTAVYGDGVWLSTDGARHWRNAGLMQSGSIAKIAIDPQDSKIVLAAAMGREFAPGGERGIYRSDDGGSHWKRVLYVNDTTGGSDVAFDPKDGNIVFAGTFDYLRRPWTMISGGIGSGLYKSVDAGKTWRKLTDPALHNGLPAGPINRVGVSVCYSNPAMVYAFVPVKNGMLYRSTDGGEHWQMRNASQEINFRPFYFSQVRCDPANPQKVFAVAGGLRVSLNGGRTFRNAGGGGDNHDLWIDPKNPRRLLNGSDLGFDYSVDGGKTWSFDNVVPFDQIYRVGYDMDVPYHVMGGLQDHEVWRGPNELPNRSDGVAGGDWLNISDWGDGQYAMADPRDPNVIYEDTHFGDLAREDLGSGERRYISPQPNIGFGTGAATYKYRFNWSAPLLISRFDPDVIYFGGNVLFRSADRGNSWTELSPDLTRCDPALLAASGGPITFDDTNAETYCTIYSIGEDAKSPETIWYGTDNGHLELTRDGGKSWQDVVGNVSGLPLPARVTSIAPSPENGGVAYATFDRHQWNDYAPYAYMTRDYGRSWTAIGRGLGSYVHVVREDPRNSQVLYAGTETGVSVSFDGGGHWNDLRLGIPRVPIFDLQVHPRDNDLILGSHGRGFYVLDDLTPLQNWSRATGSDAYLFAPMPALRSSSSAYREHGRGAYLSDNKPYGALITLYLAKAPPAPAKQKPTVTVQVLDDENHTIDRFPAAVHAGLNRFTWDLHVLPPSGTATIQDARPYYIFYPMKIRGPQVLPGTYTLRIDVNGRTLNAPVTVEMDPHHPVAAVELQRQFDALQSLAATQERVEVMLSKLDSLRRQIAALRVRAGAPARELDAYDAVLVTEQDRLRNPEPSGYRRPARLSEQLAYLRYTIEQYDGAPTVPQAELAAQYAAETASAEKDLPSLFGDKLAALNGLLRAAHLPELHS